jgi:uncharacterized protein (DUF1800 family)
VDSIRPISARSWSRDAAAHLARRTGFGAHPDDVTRLADLGPQAAVDHVVEYERVADAPVPPAERTDLMRWTEQIAAILRTGMQFEMIPAETRAQLARANREYMVAVAGRWIRTMIETRRPLQEKMTLFWHGHFATSFGVVGQAIRMENQLEMLRRGATGNFRALLLGVSRDPAMLRYLDNYRSRREHPNENYARELMELFSLGIGNYSEDDVKAAARAFTGWTFRGDEFFFNRSWHDDGQKTFLGRTGRLTGEDVIDIILQQPAAAPFLAAKLARFFVMSKVAPTLASALADVFRSQRFEVKPLLRTMFLSEAFYAPETRRQQIKSPADLAVGAVRTLGLKDVPDEVLFIVMGMMGQSLFYPANVSGWPMGRGWINSATLLARHNFALLLTESKMPGLPQRFRSAVPRPALERLVPAGRTCGEVVDGLSELLLQRKAPDAHREIFVRALGGNERAVVDAARTQAELRTVLALMMSTGDYQMS